jgi:geranylgeranyl pyrophosphate synthase
VHDDTVDRSAERRGQATLNARWGAEAAVLAGDWLFARAARFATATGSIRVMELFARTLQTLTDGELRQLFGRRGVPDREEYEARIYAKTAALFEAATEMAAVIARLDGSTSRALADYGRHLGLAFQIVDDILDFTGDRDRLGKPVGSDLRSGVITLPAIFHLDHTGGTGDGEIEALIAAVAANERAIGSAWDAARAHLGLALEALDALPPSEARDHLKVIATNGVERDA